MRLRLACAAALAIACSAIGASPALADAPRAAFDPPTTRPVFDPQTTNVPYLAWRGEQVRLVKCEPLLGDIPDPWSADGSPEFNAKFVVEQWSGTGWPVIETTTPHFVDENNPNGLYWGKH